MSQSSLLYRLPEVYLSMLAFCAVWRFLKGHFARKPLLRIFSLYTKLVVLLLSVIVVVFMLYSYVLLVTFLLVSAPLLWSAFTYYINPGTKHNQLSLNIIIIYNISHGWLFLHAHGHVSVLLINIKIVSKQINSSALIVSNCWSNRTEEKIKKYT